MNAVLEVESLAKSYPGFRLKDVSFALRRGSIMGLIGRNGAGKTTILKCLLGLVHPDGGSVRFFGRDWASDEAKIKPRIGYSGGNTVCYGKKTVAEIAAMTRRFYPHWEDEAWDDWLRRFSLDPAKTPEQLSEGMKVKLNLALALSHHAEVLILDEPSSGLDPVSREEMVTIFKRLKIQGVSILFSTHITSDLEKCADDITYIREGELAASEPLADFVAYRRVRGFGSNLENIMIHYEKEAFLEKLDD